jgi:transposase
MNRFTIQDFTTKYGSEEVCLDRMFQLRYGKLKICPSCKKETNFYKRTDKKAYACQWCGYLLSPLAGTIFHKSDTKLTSWFFALYLFSTSKNGVSGMELQRQLGCTYKTAWRIAKQIRLLFEENKDILSKIVELDETYVGGKGGNNKRGRGAENKTPVFGMVERKGIIKATVTVDTKRKTVMPIIKEHVKIGTSIMTDEYLPYQSLDKEGYDHQTVNHGQKQYVNGLAHTNTLEGFWSQLKRSINGTHHAVSPKYLQQYVNEFSWKYNHRVVSAPLFDLMLLTASMPL